VNEEALAQLGAVASQEKNVTQRHYFFNQIRLSFPVATIILSWIFRKSDVGVWTGLILLSVGTGGGHL
jgi:hypothetical protein